MLTSLCVTPLIEGCSGGKERRDGRMASSHLMRRQRNVDWDDAGAKLGESDLRGGLSEVSSATLTVSGRE